MNSLHCQQLVSILAPTQQYRAQERPVHCPSCAWPSGKIQSRIPQAEDAWHTSLPCFKKKHHPGSRQDPGIGDHPAPKKHQKPW